MQSGGTVLATTNVALTVLPFALQAPVMDYGVYYTGLLRSGTVSGINATNKSVAQYTAELQDMLNHGIQYPTLFQANDIMLGSALSIRKSVGFPTDRLYTLGVRTNTVSNLSALVGSISAYQAVVKQYGQTTLYVYGADEVGGTQLSAELPTWQAIHALGAKVFAAVNSASTDAYLKNTTPAYTLVGGGLLDVANIGGGPWPNDVAAWHKDSSKVYMYGNPHAGIENPDLYHRNYGLKALCNGYDGAMDFAYQDDFGAQIWNDFSNSPLPGAAVYRSEVYAYPTSNGVIDTVQWEGFRAAINDVRYLTTLAKANGPSVYPSFCASNPNLASANLNSVRQSIISQILASGTP